MSEYKPLTTLTENGIVVPINEKGLNPTEALYECMRRLNDLEEKIKSGKLIELPYIHTKYPYRSEEMKNTAVYEVVAIHDGYVQVWQRDDLELAKKKAEELKAQ